MKVSSVATCEDTLEASFTGAASVPSQAPCESDPCRFTSKQLAKYRSRVLNSYALVCYLPEPLGSFFDHLSKKLVPHCQPRSHITLLPPRHLSGPRADAETTIESVAATLSPFEVEITSIEIFDVTSVIYADVGEGRERLMQIHKRLDSGALRFDEQFPFHPHITLSIDATADQIPELAQYARDEWKAFPYERRFTVETLHLVHNVAPGTWKDVRRFHLF